MGMRCHHRYYLTLPSSGCQFLMSTQLLPLPALLHSAAGCERCIDHFRGRLERVEGVVGIVVTASQAVVQVEYEPERVSAEHLQAEAHRIGADLERLRDHRTLRLHDLHCPDCALTIQKVLRQVPGVVWADVNFATMQLFVEYEREAVSLEQIRRVV